MTRNARNRQALSAITLSALIGLPMAAGAQSAAELKARVAELEQALAADATAAANFRRWTPTQRKYLINWVASAKKEATRLSRAARAVEVACRLVERYDLRTGPAVPPAGASLVEIEAGVQGLRHLHDGRELRSRTRRQRPNLHRHHRARLAGVWGSHARRLQPHQGTEHRDHRRRKRGFDELLNVLIIADYVYLFTP